MVSDIILLTFWHHSADTGMAVVDKADRSSSMDTWQLCKLYNCDKCAGHEISSYSGAAHSQYMHKCSDDFLR